MGTLHAIANWVYHVGGFRGSGPWYGAWSGFLSDLGEVAIIGGLISMYRKHVCAVDRCWRVGHRPVAGTDHIVCRRHHPAPAPTHAEIIEAHRVAIQPTPAPKPVRKR